MALTTGTKLGPYQIVAPIGAGGMGEVYRALDTRLGREVALKILPQSLATDADRLHRFEQEARAIAALNHPNILELHDVGEHEASPYLVCELLEGETLREKLSGGPLSQRRAMEYASQIAAGLAAAHDHGLVHRDLKPENIFIVKDGRVKILDFGLAKLRKTAHVAAADGETQGPMTMAGGAKTSPGMVLGTVGYMSPEQVRGQEVDQRTDIFALGAILYEMLSGQRAFHGDSSVETMNAILKEDPPEFEGETLRVSPAVERIVRRCLEKDPGQRFQSAKDLMFSIEAISGSAQSSSAVVASPAIGSGRKWMPLAVGLVAAMALAAFAYFAGRFTGGDRPVENQFQLRTFRPQIIFRAAFAPDGKTIVYSTATWANRPDIYILSPEYPEARATDLKNTMLLSVSSKGDLAVLSNPQLLGHRIFHGTLGRVPIGGSAPRAMLDDVMEADWNPEGTDLAITRVVNGKCRLEYPAGKVLAETNGYFSDLRFSPKGDHIAFLDHEMRFDDRGKVAVIDLAGNKKLLTDIYWGEEGLAWSRDGSEILFSAGTGSYSSFPVRAVSLDGKLRIVQDSAGGIWIHDVNKDGKWLVTQEGQWRDLYGFGSNSKQEINLGFLDFSSPQAISADGTTLLFTEENSFFGTNYTTCIRKMDGSPTVSLGEGNAAALTSDGTEALAIVLSSPNKLMVYPTGAGAPRQLDTGKLKTIDSASWFKDDKRALACGSEDGHGSRCYLIEESGAPKAVTPEGTYNGIPTPDGKEVLALDGGGNRQFYPIDGSAPRPAKGMDKEQITWFPSVLGWTLDGKDIIVRKEESPVSVLIQRVDPVTGKRSLLRKITVADPAGLLAIQNIALAGDGKWYAYALRRQRSSLFVVNRPK